MADLTHHLETHLGSIVGGWSAGPDGRAAPFQVVQFDGGALENTTLATLGLSNAALRSRSSEKMIRQELVVLLPKGANVASLPAIVQSLALDAISSGNALLRGEVIGPRGPLVPGATVEAFYVGIPVYLPDAFHACEVHGETVVMAWLVPITAGEARYVQSHGWQAFESLLETHDPNFLDFSRPAIPHCEGPSL